MHVIAPAQRSDLLAVAELERQVFGAHGYPDFFFRQVHDCWPEGLLVATSGHLLGYALWVAASGAKRDCWLLSLAVATRARGRGVARQLLASSLAACPAASRLLLTVAPDNRPALALYQSMGFVQLAQEESYFAPGQARLVLAHPGG